VVNIVLLVLQLMPAATPAPAYFSIFLRVMTFDRELSAFISAFIFITMIKVNQLIVNITNNIPTGTMIICSVTPWRDATMTQYYTCRSTPWRGPATVLSITCIAMPSPCKIIKVYTYSSSMG